MFHVIRSLLCSAWMGFFVLLATLLVPNTALTAQVEVEGVVCPDKVLKLRSELAGKVIQLSDHLVLGGKVVKGEELLRIERTDYEIKHAQEVAAVAKANFELKTEAARQFIASKELKLLNIDLSAYLDSKELALREPHYREKETALAAAEGRLMKAENDLRKTTVVAPFDGIVLEESVELDQVLTPQSTLATIACTDCYCVRAVVPYSVFKQLSFADEQEKGTPVQVMQRVDAQTEVVRQGEVLRHLGVVQEAGKGPVVLIRVERPLSDTTSNTKIPLFLNEKVKVRFDF